MRNFSGYFRQFEPALRGLLERGHEVHVSRDRKDEMRGQEWAEALAKDLPAFTWSETPHARTDVWHDIRRQTRLTADYVYFLRPEFEESSELVRRARRRAPDRVVSLMEREGGRFAAAGGNVRLYGALRGIERAMPSSRAMQAYISKLEPDVVLLTPHLMPGSMQAEYLQAAKDIGIRTILCVASWDNLSSKQLIRVVPDAVTVWNETQRTEAIDIHGLPPDRVIATGAQLYDHWFDWEARPREVFCDRVGIDPKRPFVLYVAGALFPAEITEADFFNRWIAAVRSCAHPELRDAQVLVRPHPKRFPEWGPAGIEELEGVAMWPQEGRMPVETAAKQDFYDSIFHSAGVAGVNTSAMIEAGIVGKRVHTVLVPEFEGSQFGTLHFRYLTEVGGGLLCVGQDMDEHLDQLAETVRRDGSDEGASRSFLEAFIRPNGVEEAATPVFVQTVEEVAARGKFRPERVPVRLHALRLALRPARIGFNLWGVNKNRRNKKRKRAARAAAEAAAAR